MGVEMFAKSFYSIEMKVLSYTLVLKTNINYDFRHSAWEEKWSTKHEEKR